MSRTVRNSVLLAVISLLVLGLAATVQAAEEGGDSANASTTTVAEDSGLSPAVSIPADESAATEPDWTYRYLIPTGLVLAGIIVIVTSVKYFTDVVRKRYRIVE